MSQKQEGEAGCLEKLITERLVFSMVEVFEENGNSPVCLDMMMATSRGKMTSCSAI
jgi:hypothetical protein